MKLSLTSALLAALLFAGGLRDSQAAATVVNLDFFYTTLEPYGEWIDVEDYGYCWHPSGVDADWRPYTVGHWAYTDAGWTWISDEPFGWVTFHYGRWADFDEVGWVWVPDTEWAPAWVSFRNSEEYIGWAPLPPEAHFGVNVGFSRWVDACFDIGPTLYSFVPIRRFSAPVIREVIVQPTENITIFSRTVNVTNITQRKNVVFVGGPQVDTVSAKVERPIARLKLERQAAVDASAGAQGKLTARVEGDRLLIPAPKVNSTTAVAPPKKIAQKITPGKVDRGWTKVTDTATANELRAKIKREEKVPAGLPAAPKFERAKAEQPEAVGEKLREPKTSTAPGVGPAKGPAETPEQPRKQVVPPAAPTEVTPPAPRPEAPVKPERPKATQSEPGTPTVPENPPRLQRGTPQGPPVPERERPKQPEQPKASTPPPPPLPQREKPQSQTTPQREPPPVGERVPVAPRREAPPPLPNVEKPPAPLPPPPAPERKPNAPAAELPAPERKPNAPATDQPAPEKRKKPGGAEPNR